MSLSCRRMIEDTKLKENFGCGVCTRHSGRAKIAHKKCLYFACGYMRTQTSKKKNGSGVGKYHYGRAKIAHGLCLYPAGG